MSVNLFGRDASFERSVARIAAAFGAARCGACAPTREGNTVVLAWRDVDAARPRHAVGARADPSKARWGLPARKWLRMLRSRPLSRRRMSRRHDHASAPRAAKPADSAPAPHAAARSTGAAARLAARRRRDQRRRGARAPQRFGAGDSAQHPLVRLAAAG